MTLDPRPVVPVDNDPRPIMPGDRVLVFDTRLYVDDKKTPLSVTMQPATVIRRYGRVEKIVSPDFILGPYPDLLDVLFDHDGRVSTGHFTRGVKVIGASIRRKRSYV